MQSVSTTPTTIFLLYLSSNSHQVYAWLLEISQNPYLKTVSLLIVLAVPTVIICASSQLGVSTVLRSDQIWLDIMVTWLNLGTWV